MFVIDARMNGQCRAGDAKSRVGYGEISMKRNTARFLIRCGGGLSGVLCLTQTAAYGQESAPPQAGQIAAATPLEEVVVTAEKRDRVCLTRRHVDSGTRLRRFGSSAGDSDGGPRQGGSRFERQYVHRRHPDLHTAWYRIQHAKPILDLARRRLCGPSRLRVSIYDVRRRIRRVAGRSPEGAAGDPVWP